jgi:AcrR family transcriptional regulator
MADETTLRDRSAQTRERLLDAAEALVADEGYAAPSHRSIAGRAGVHVALLNYHYGSKELLYDAVVSRRASRLVEAWRDALVRAAASPPITVEKVLRAYWSPFGEPDALADGPWRNYLCAVAWLSQASNGSEGWSRAFGAVERGFLAALRLARPQAAPDALERGFRYARALLDAVLLRRCNRADGACAPPPPGLRETDVDGLIAFLAAGIDSLPDRSPAAQTCRVVRTAAVADD